MSGNSGEGLVEKVLPHRSWSLAGIQAGVPRMSGEAERAVFQTPVHSQAGAWTQRPWTG